MDRRSDDYVRSLRARAQEERARARLLRDPDAAGACLRLADQYDSVAVAYDRLEARERG
jgi:hypothetical protein